MDAEVEKIYGNKVRVRACGILAGPENILMVNHRSLAKKDFWAPPGGGIEFGETTEECLKREFLEETGLHVRVGGLLFVCEFIRRPLHGIELFFLVEAVGGELKTGTDPEMKSGEQLIQEVSYLSWTMLEQAERDCLHGIFSKVQHPSDILQLKGYLTI
jgi:8-oxo-dGTP diphosphatase